MSKRRDFAALGNPVRQDGSSFPSMTVLFAVSAIALGAGVILALPDDADTNPPATSASAPTASAPESTGSTTASADESLCDKQSWPYIDQRCAQRVEAARGTRQVRIVTDKGNSVTVRSPEPIVEAKPKPTPQAPVGARVEKPLGPPAAPVAGSPPQIEKVVAGPQRSAPAPQNAAPQTVPPSASTVQTAAAPANPPVTSDFRARGTFDPSANMGNAPVAPAAASTAPAAAGVDAFADANFRKSKSARAEEKAARREARRQKAIAEGNGDMPEELVGQNSRRARHAMSDRGRGGVPEEVLQAIEQAAASESRGRRGRQIVTIGSTRNGNRVYLVPGNEIGGW